MWWLKLFGAPTLEGSGRTHSLTRRKARALLAYLAVTQQSHSRETLTALLWPDHDPQQGRADLSRILSNLRTVLGANCIVADRQQIALSDQAPLWVDVVTFREQLAACRETAVGEMDETYGSTLAAAVDCYQADFLAGFTLPDCPLFDEWQFLQTEALRHDLSWALDKLVQLHEAQNNLTQAIVYARRWVALDPLSEVAQRRLMALYGRNGQRAEAHRQYQLCERLLAEELGIKPEPETTQLYEQIRQGEAARELTTLDSRSAINAALPQKLAQEIRYFLSEDDVRIAYSIVGSGPPLVWAASFLRHLEFDWQTPIWQHWLAALTSRYTLIRYDERACGLSDWEVNDISFDAWLRDLEGLVDHLGLEQFRLLALSQAGAVAIAYAVRHPQRVSHLILHGAYARGRFHRQEIPQAAEEAQTLLSLTRLGWGQDNPAFRQVFSMQLVPGATREQLTWFDELMRISMTAENAARAEAAMYHINVLDRLPELGVPTLVTHSRQDAAVPFAEGRILASQIPGALFVPLDSKNHLLLPAEPAWKEFIQHVDRFMAAEPGSRLSASPGQPAAHKIPRFDWPKPRGAQTPPFVARTAELAQLNSHLDDVLAGNGRIAFVTGGAGRGKTSLLAEFARRVQAAHKDLIVAGGSGTTFAGVGDPYLPFREVIELLTGNVTALRQGGPGKAEQARRLWTLMPRAVQAILQHGPQLLDLFVSGRQLLARAAAVAPAGAGWLLALQQEVARRQQAPGTVEQTAVFGQVTHVLHHLAQNQPLLLTLDDLQWLDAASLGLLFHLGRRLAGSRILIVGAYRPDELPRGEDNKPHLLVQIVDELKRNDGDIFIDLAAADRREGMAFIEALLDTEPNQLDTAFRQALFQRTGGHPLFVVELLREMQNRGDLVQDEAGRWHIGEVLDWQMLPARVEAVIAHRVERLPAELRAVLDAASVLGEQFTAEVVARMLDMAERPLLHSLSRQLGKQQRLVQERGELKVGETYLAVYQFSHALFQQYLYLELAPGECRRLHSAAAEALVELYAKDLDQAVAPLAYHYTAAADWPQATKYHTWAGDLALAKASLPDAVVHYRTALTHWPSADRMGQAKVLGKLGECLWILGQHEAAVGTVQASYNLYLDAGDKQGMATAHRLLGRIYWELGEVDKAGRSYRQALDVLEGEPESEALAWAMASIANYHMHLGNYEESIRVGQQALDLARRLGADTLIIQCLCDLGSAISSQGEWAGLEMEQESLELALAANRPHDAARAYLYIAEGLLYLGHYAQARELLQEAIVYMQRLQVPYVAAGAALLLAELEQLTGRWTSALKLLQTKADHAAGPEFAGLPQLYRSLLLGRLYNDLGLGLQAHTQLTEALASLPLSLDPRVALLGELARAEALLGQQEAAVAAAEEILKLTGQARYLFPNTSLALLFICRLPVIFSLPQLVRLAQIAYQQLARLDRQFHTPAITACFLEAKGWLALAEGDVIGAAAFRQAADKWETLGHPYDQARTLSSLGQILGQAGDWAEANLAAARAEALLNALAAQVEDPTLRASFLSSPLARTIRSGFEPK